MLKAICKFCGKEFVKKNKNSKCCSQECSQALYRQEHRVMYEKICSICGRKFETTLSRAKYCSSLCAHDASVKASREYARRVSHEPRACAECGKVFAPKTNAGKFCSPECKRAHLIKTGKAFKPRKCAYCGKEFIPKSTGAKYCGEECRKAGKSENLKKKVSMHERNLGASEKKKAKKKSDYPNVPSSKRWEKMSLAERGAECRKHRLTYGQAQTKAYFGMLPEDFGEVKEN